MLKHKIQIENFVRFPHLKTWDGDAATTILLILQHILLQF